MSKIGKSPISIPQGVEVKIEDKDVTVKGPKGEIVVERVSEIDIEEKDSQIIFTPVSQDSENAAAYWGLMRALVNNAVVGVTEEFSKELEIVGVGYRAEMAGADIRIMIGYSHPVVVQPPEGIKFELEDNNMIKVIGADKQKVGQVAANIRAIRKPEPYKGKGIKYKDEVIKRKQGKAAKAAAA